MKLGEVLRSARKAQGLTLKDIEVATGIHNGYLSQVETGKITNPNPNTLRDLAPHYGMSYDLLMYAAGYAPPAQPVLTDIPPYIIQAARMFTTEDWEALRGVVDALVRARLVLSHTQEPPHDPR